MGAGQNVTAERLRQGKVAFGLAVQIMRTVQVARFAANAGYHYLFIDLQHSTMDLDTTMQICVAALDAGVTPMVRVPSLHDVNASRLLDGGAQGIVFPDVNTAEEARDAVARCLFPPDGRRSFAGLSAALLPGTRPVAEAAAILNKAILTTITIESVEGVENVEAIAAVPGVDIIAVGSKDLTLDMGIPDQYEHPRVLDAYRKVAAAAKKNGVAFRFGGVEDAATVRRNVEEFGVRLVTISTDLGFLTHGMRSMLSTVSGGLDRAVL